MKRTSSNEYIGPTRCFLDLQIARFRQNLDDRRVCGEFFNITFEEAVAELDKHAAEISAALADADQRYLAKKIF